MRVTSSSGKARDAAKRGPAAGQPVSLKALRIKRGLTQKQVAERSGMHRNSIRKIERGLTREITEENAVALSAVLGIRAEDLGLHIRRPAAEAPSIRLRRLTAEQRQLLDEMLSLPEEDFRLLREALADLRKRSSKRKRGKGGR